jgi:hypothetical protein
MGRYSWSLWPHYWCTNSAPALAVGYPHGLKISWEYTSLFSLLDYPFVILPIPKPKVYPELDCVDETINILKRTHTTNPIMNYESLFSRFSLFYLH